MKRRLTPFEVSLVDEIATLSALLVDRLNDRGDDPDAPEYSALSSTAIGEIIDAAIRTAVTRKRLAHFRRLRRAGQLEAAELKRLHLDGVDLDSWFSSEDLLP